MAISLVESNIARTNGTPPDAAYTFTTPPATGDSVVVSITHFDVTGQVLSVTDTKSNTYTRRGATTNIGSRWGEAFTAHNVTGGATFTVTIDKPDADSCAAWVSAWTGVSTTTAPTGTSATGSGTSPSITSGTLSGESVVVAHCGNNSGSNTQTQPGAPWILIGDEEDAGLYTDNNCVYQIASSGTLTATWTLSVSIGWMAHQVTLVASGGATCALGDTITAATTEADIRAGGKIITLTLTGDTWIPS